jgi:hypothetical protein
MSDKPNDHWFEVYGMPGVRYMKEGKYYDPQKKPVLTDSEAPEPEKKEVEPEPLKVFVEPEKVAEIKENAFMPVVDVPDDLELVDRVKIKGPNDPNFLKKSDIKAELRKLRLAFDASASRETLLNKLKESIGLLEDI